MKKRFYWARPKNFDCDFEPMQIDEDGTSWMIGSEVWVRSSLDQLEIADEIVIPDRLRRE